VIAWALEALVAATLLMLLVLAVRKPVGDLFGAQWAYSLWLLPLVLPFFPAMPAIAPLPMPEMTVILPQVAESTARAATSGSGDWLLILLALWAGGAVAFAIWQQSTYSAFMLHLGSGGRAARPPVYGGIEVVASEAVEGPVAVGIFRRRIVVPLDFESRYSPSERRLALEHELVHHKRRDLVWNWAALAMLTVNWFNPIAHLAFRAFRADQELACDAAVTCRSPHERHDYASALVKAASQPGLIAVCPLNHADFLKRRLRMMKQHRSSRARSLGGLASVAAVAAVGLALGGPGFAYQESAPARMLANVAAPRAVAAAAQLPLLGKAPREPQVLEVVAKSAEKMRGREKRPVRTKLKVDAPKLDAALAGEAAAPQQLAEIASMVPVVPSSQHIHRASDRMAEVREALGRARAQLAAARLGHQRMVTMAHHPRPRLISVKLEGTTRREIEAALAEAGHAIATLELGRELRTVRVEINREVRVLHGTH
jgi:beta-lactamase regulating signal transducer with metallopeptidase domain